MSANTKYQSLSPFQWVQIIAYYKSQSGIWNDKIPNVFWDNAYFFTLKGFWRKHPPMSYLVQSVIKLNSQVSTWMISYIIWFEMNGLQNIDHYREPKRRSLFTILQFSCHSLPKGREFYFFFIYRFNQNKPSGA